MKATHLEWLTQQLPNAEVVPVSALQGRNIDRLESLIAERLPESEHFYPEDQLTDKSSRFLAAELVREKVMRQLGAEIPYQVTVEIDHRRGRQDHRSGVAHHDVLVRGAIDAGAVGGTQALVEVVDPAGGQRVHRLGVAGGGEPGHQLGEEVDDRVAAQHRVDV